MIERITEKEMMQRINHVKEQLILTQGEGDMRFQEFRKWVRNQISEWYDNNEDYKKEIEEEDERLNERFGAETFEADTPDPINPEYIEEAVQNLPKEQYLEFCDYFEIDPNDEKELSQFLQKNRNDSNVLMKLDVLNLDAWYDSRYGSYGSLFRAENFEAERYKPTPKEIRFLVRNLRAVWTKYERGVYDEDEVLDKTGRVLYHTGVMQEEYVAEGFDAESERTFTVSKGPKRMYIVVEYNDGKELFLDGDGQKQFMEELAEAEATRDEILIEKLFGVGSDYHGIAEEVVEAEGFEAQGYDEIEVEKYVEIDWETDPHPHPYDDDINNSEIFDEVSGYVEDAVERRGRDSGNGNIDVEIEVEDKEENEVVEKTVRVEYDYHLQGESFEATKGIDTYSQPFEELRIKPSKAKVGILLASIVAGGLLYANIMKED